MARSGGFEPPTAWFVARYSIQLSYERVVGANYSELALSRQLFFKKNILKNPQLTGFPGPFEVPGKPVGRAFCPGVRRFASPWLKIAVTAAGDLATGGPLPARRGAGRGETILGQATRTIFMCTPPRGLDASRGRAFVPGCL